MSETPAEYKTKRDADPNSEFNAIIDSINEDLNRLRVQPNLRWDRDTITTTRRVLTNIVRGFDIAFNNGQIEEAEAYLEQLRVGLVAISGSVAAASESYQRLVLVSRSPLIEAKDK